MTAPATSGSGDQFLLDYGDLVAAGYGPYLTQLANQGYSAVDAVLQTQFKRASDEVHALAVTISKAQAAGQADAVAPLKAQLQYWLGQMGQQASAAHATEKPSALLVALDHFSDDAIATAKSVGVTGLSLLGNLPLILGLLLGLGVLWLLLQGRE